MYNRHTEFEFDPRKEELNLKKHGIDFKLARQVFQDPEWILDRDPRHSEVEERWFAIGKVPDGRVITVWFTYRGDQIRIIGAAELRKGRKEYEKRKVS